MMLWTIYPPEVVFKNEEEAPRHEEISVGNRIFMVSRTKGGQRQIERLISTDPADYMNPTWQPGQILMMEEQK